MKLRQRFSAVSRIKRRNSVSIKWKLFGYLALLTGVMLGILWLFQVVFLDDFYKAIKINQIRSAADSIARNIDNQDLDDLVTRISQSNEVCIVVSDSMGNAVCSADILPDCVIHKMPLQQGWIQLYEQAKENGGTYLERFVRDRFKNKNYDSGQFAGRVPPHDGGMSESMIYTKIVLTNSGQERMILLNSTISPVSATVSAIRVEIVLITGIMLVLALVLAIFISRRISSPTVKINEAAKVLATGTYDIQFENTGYREISELADTLNYAARELSKVEGLRRELIANISHDLRTPLTMITGYAEVMRDLPGENTPENVQIIIEEAKRLTSLVNDVLDLSKFQSGTQKLNCQPFSLTQAVAETLKRYSKLTGPDGYHISFLHDGDVWVCADQLRISQVVYNLVNNALTYTGEDKSVIVRQSVADGWVKIEVIDTGEGIPEDKLPLIWDRYYKVDKEHRRAAVGTGLGLSIVRSVLDLHHAQYGVQSTLGEGSIFWFALPVDQPQLPENS